jgi:hypothetical protein
MKTRFENLKIIQNEVELLLDSIEPSSDSDVVSKQFEFNYCMTCDMAYVPLGSSCVYCPGHFDLRDFLGEENGFKADDC